MKTSEALRKAKSRIAKRSAWFRGWSNRKPGQLCAALAIHRVTITKRDNRAADEVFKRANRIRGIAAWNDRPGRTHPQVMAAFDKAIALAEAEEAAHV